jgi:dTMP kinase
MQSGKLITIEGLDGAGKTTLAGGLRDALEQRGIAVTLLREPGGVRAAERIRAIVKDPEAVIGDRAEALLYAAARAQLVEEAILPRLRSGETILLDRFVDSSLAYQGVGRGLGIESVRAINAFATGGLVADRTLLLELDPGLGRRRSHRRGEGLDRLERQPDAFFDRIAAGYRQLADAEPGRFRRLDAGLSSGEVLERAIAAVADLFEPFG